ncbi:helix-turn-helix domain-containing protein [Lacticaseibacillus jixiensis]|uniref:helix-turn-helix domain-containing protein n=1 Tax=Lacticaseibacillus jixiensis TaxID=3231926 RepID=UPI0036F30E41
MLILRHGGLIKKLRIERNLTQEQLSAGITSRNSLAASERGGSSITFDNLVLIQVALTKKCTTGTRYNSYNCVAQSNANGYAP